MPPAKAVGIDFGTTTSFVAQPHRDPEAHVVNLAQDKRRFMPSVAGYHGQTLVIGEDAEALELQHQVRSVKSLITEGREKQDVDVDGNIISASRDVVIVEILKEIVRRARTAGLRLEGRQDVRLGCPAMWDQGQREILCDLARAARLRIGPDQLIEEPVAAGIAWLSECRRKNVVVDGRLLVFDVGGGTLDTAVLQVSNVEQSRLTVLSSMGSTNAGDATDAIIADDIRDEIEFDVDAPGPRAAKARRDLETKSRYESRGVV